LSLPKIPSESEFEPQRQSLSNGGLQMMDCDLNYKWLLPLIEIEKPSDA